MTQLAPCNSVEAITAGGGLLPRLRAWFARSATAYTAALRDHDASERVTAGGDDSNNDFNPAVAAAHDVEPVAPPCSERQTAILLPFPIRGEALLVKLADQLRDRIASSVTKRDSFILTMSRCSYSRLIIDGAAHIEFLADTAIYRLVIGVEQDTRIIVETSDFDTVVKFVAQYVADRLSGEMAGEIAS